MQLLLESRGVNSLCWGGWREALAEKLPCMLYAVFFFLHTSSKSASPVSVICQDEGSLLTLKCGLLHLQGERVRREVNCGGLSLVVPRQEAPQRSGTSSDD